MTSLIFSLSAAGCTSFSSLFYRKNADASTANYSPNGYLVLFYGLSFLLSFAFYPEIWNAPFNWITTGIGGCVGLLNLTLMVLTSRALMTGPAGLTYAVINASAVFPGLLLFALLGTEFGFSTSFLQVGGMLLVLLGLFMGAKGESGEGSTSSSSPASMQWLKYALGCFLAQVLALTLIQARCVLFEGQHLSGIFSQLTLTEKDDVWFMPGLFGISFITQTVIFLAKKQHLQRSEVIYGGLGGIANFLSTLFLLLATKFALPFEKGILFPCFAVASMVMCNLWATKLYKEKFNFKSNILCSLGIFLAVSN